MDMLYEIMFQRLEVTGMPRKLFDHELTRTC